MPGQYSSNRKLTLKLSHTLLSFTAEKRVPPPTLWPDLDVVYSAREESIHPLSIATYTDYAGSQGVLETGTDPSRHWVRGKVTSWTSCQFVTVLTFTEEHPHNHSCTSKDNLRVANSPNLHISGL